jgi:hypothetical protein
LVGVLCAGGLLAAAAATGAVADTAPGTGMLAESTIKARMLTIREITRASGTMAPVTTEGIACHEMPYIKTGNVRYCFYMTLRSDAAYAAGRLSVTHVDVLSFDVPSEGPAYLKEMGNVGGPQSRTLAKSPTGVTRFDPAAAIPIGANADGTPINKTGATVTVYALTGSNFVYATCANPNGSAKGLRACANRVVAAQLTKLNR